MINMKLAGGKEMWQNLQNGRTANKQWDKINGRVVKRKGLNWR